MPLSARQEYNLWHIMTGDIPAAAVIDWTGMTSLDRMEQQEALSRAPYTTVRQRVLGSQSAYFEPQNEMIHSLPGDMTQRKKTESVQKSVLSALEEGDFNSALGIAKNNMNEDLVHTLINSPARYSNKTEHFHFEQTSLLQELLGTDAYTGSYMSRSNRKKFYERFILKASEEDRKRLEFELYLDMYGCVIYSYLLGVLRVLNRPMSEFEHHRFIDLLYANADKVFNSTDFSSSYTITSNNEPITSSNNPNEKDIGIKNRKVLTDGLLLNLIGKALNQDLSEIEVTSTPTERTRYAIGQDVPGNVSHKVLNYYNAAGGAKRNQGGSMGLMADDPLIQRQWSDAHKNKYKDTSSFTPFGVYFGLK